MLCVISSVSIGINGDLEFIQIESLNEKEALSDGLHAKRGKLL